MNWASFQGLFSGCLLTIVVGAAAAGLESDSPRPDSDGSMVSTAIGMVVVLSLVLVSVVLVVMCLHKRRSEPDPELWNTTEQREGISDEQREGISDEQREGISDEQREGISNATYSIPISPLGTATGPSGLTDNYDYATEATDTISDLVEPDRTTRCEEPPHDYATADEWKENKTEEPVEYAYATTGPSVAATPPLLNSTRYTYTFTSDGGSLKARIPSCSSSDAIYMTPATDENSLYAQFHEIRIKELQRQSIQEKEELGSGQFGMVHKAEWNENSRAAGSQLVAVKTLKTGANGVDKVKFLQEAAIMGQFSHPNVVKLHGVVIHGEPFMIVLELLTLGDLREHLISSKETPKLGIDEHTLLSYCRQIAAGMTYLSGKQFIHRDLAARNILVSEDGVCKIADFGMARDITDETYYISQGGKIPVRWTAPEALHYKKFSTASDVWSFGCVMYEIWSLGHKPFEAFSNNQTMLEVEQGYRLAPPPGCPRIIYRLMIQCWHPIKSERPTFTDLTQGLSLPDTRLLKWSEEDKAVHPAVSELGGQLNYTANLYLDLQESYVVNTTSMGSYDTPLRQ